MALYALVFSSISAAASPVLDRIVEDGVLRVGMSLEQPPFNVRSGDGASIGYDVDLARALAEAMQVELEIVKIPFADLLPALRKGRVDAVISGLTITPERSRSVSFVGPYTLSGKSILTTQRIKAVVKEPTDFNSAEIRIVALKDSTSAAYVQKKLPDALFDAIDNYNEGIEMLLTGKVDALVADVPVLKLAQLRYPEANLGIIEPALSIEPLGIAIDRNARQLDSLLRNYLRAFQHGGLLPRLQHKWFEDNSWVERLPARSSQ
jgi:ABC-type amino acid transport substrate-binding protein